MGIAIINETKMNKENLVEIITERTQNWQPCGKVDGVFVEEEEPFFSRINLIWAEEVADKILERLKEEEKEKRIKVRDKEIKRVRDSEKQNWQKELVKKIVEKIIKETKELAYETSIGDILDLEFFLKGLEKLKEDLLKQK